MTTLQSDVKQFFSMHLLEWFGKHQRDLPWRRTKDPYHIWVSEIMLQQTRVDTVIPYFNRFVEKFPTIEALADAEQEQVLKAWEGLGYYSRARNLQTAVREVKERYGAMVPDSKEQISSLKGVGPYTAGAILSIAYNRPEPAVDGNVMRVLSRFFLLEEDIAKPSVRTKMEQLAAGLIPQGSAGDFNQALMEFGALICTPKSPQCLVCPVMERCEGRLAGMELSLPVKKKTKAPKVEQRIVALIEGGSDKSGMIRIRRRPDTGLLAGMWELPHVQVGKTERSADNELTQLTEHIYREEGLKVLPVRPLLELEHVFSHIRWKLKVVLCQHIEDAYSLISDQEERFERDGHCWIRMDEIEEYTFPNAFIKIIKAYQAGSAI